MLGVIPAAGKGTRLRELGRLYPKSILPVRERPLLVWNVEWLKSQGCDEIVVVANHQKAAIQEVIETYDLDVKIADVEIEGGGLSQSVLSGIEGSDSKEDRPVLVLLGDLMVDGGEVDFSSNSVSTFTVSDWSRWCMVDPETGIFYDKPEDRPPTDQAISGVYHILSSHEFRAALSLQLVEKVRIRGEFQISTALSKLKQPVKCFDLDILDFGTLSDFLKNRGLRNSRSFNDVKIGEDRVSKRSQKRKKIISELNWYQSIPTEIVTRTPRILGSDLHGSNGAEYVMERVYDPTLRELYLFLDRDTELWTRIFEECFSVHDKMGCFTSQETSRLSLLEKTERRIREGGYQDESIVNRFFTDLSNSSSTFEKSSSLIHGDFCFSNICFNNSNNRITMLDPRGELYGSRFYDIAKLRHSVLYGYDWIDSELYSLSGQGLKVFDDGTEHLKDLYRKMEGERFSDEEIRYLELLTASLFLTMIPLHDHNLLNQQIYYNTFRDIYKKLK